MNNQQLQKVFQSLSAKLQKKQDILQKTQPTIPSGECLCEQKLYYVKQTAAGRTFEVCPSCNPKFSCNMCDGSGNIEAINPDTGYTELVPYGCDCIITEQRVALLNKAKIPEKYLNVEFSFGNVKYGFSHIDKEMAEKFSNNQTQIMNFCEKIYTVIKNGPLASDKYFLTLLGPVGTGKTHFAICALKHLIWKFGVTGRFIDFQSLLHQIRDSYTRKLSENEIMDPLRTVDVLVIDEFGKGRSENEWEIEKLDDIVNSRYNNGKITIITTNYLPPEMHSILYNKNKDENTEGRYDASVQWYAKQTRSDTNKNGNQNYWNVNLLDRIGERMYDRILEVSEFVDFTGIPSFRKRLASDFLTRYKASTKQE